MEFVKSQACFQILLTLIMVLYVVSVCVDELAYREYTVSTVTTNFYDSVTTVSNNISVSFGYQTAIVKKQNNSTPSHFFGKDVVYVGEWLMAGQACFYLTVLLIIMSLIHVLLGVHKICSQTPHSDAFVRRVKLSCCCDITFAVIFLLFTAMICYFYSVFEATVITFDSICLTMGSMCKIKTKRPGSSFIVTLLTTIFHFTIILSFCLACPSRSNDEKMDEKTVSNPVVSPVVYDVQQLETQVEHVTIDFSNKRSPYPQVEFVNNPKDNYYGVQTPPVWSPALPNAPKAPNSREVTELRL